MGDWGLATGGCRRSGVSLLEVLISVFVLSIGLLGVAAMLPVGRYEMVEAAKADRSAVVGRAALREVKIRRMLEFYQYDVTNYNTPTPIEMWDPTGVAASVATGTPAFPFVLIDPLYYYRAGATGNTVFPNTNANADANGVRAAMSRVDLRTAPISSGVAMRTTTVSEEIFEWHDEVLFDNTGDPDLRPTRVVSSSTGEPSFDKNYSWMAMARYDTSSSGAMPQTGPRATVWIVVFYKRNFTAVAGTTNAERVAAGINFTGGGYGGGETTITLNNIADAERLKKNQWIFVAGFQSPSTDISAGAWYRVVSVAEQDPDDPTNLVRYVTLAGPDWDTTNFNYPNCQAILMEGVVNVFTETVELNRDLLRVPKQ